ncbi:hypothetical protein G9272_33275 [Streptomyces asoensis]|uniref:Gliding motility protein n=2 Tax=Streptomyces asoensis TaxID=249586 RepID=A0A6M4WWF6_9ACTN|nr:hypothetical protein G9272_33275 [Streptomyces asoensis]
MGVLARIFRRSRATEEATAETASAADTPTGTPMDGIEAEPTGAPTSAQESAEAEEAGSGAEPEPDKTTEPVAVAATDGVEIPRQQSAEEAADSEAGEGARA